MHTASPMIAFCIAPSVALTTHANFNTILIVFNPGEMIGRWLSTLIHVKSSTSPQQREPIPNTYSIHGTVLNTTDHAKYLGVTISSNLSWKKNTSITSPKRLIPPCPRSDEVFGPALRVPSLTRTRRSTHCRVRLICLVPSLCVSDQPTRNSPMSSCKIRETWLTPEQAESPTC